MGNKTSSGIQSHNEEMHLQRIAKVMTHTLENYRIYSTTKILPDNYRDSGKIHVQLPDFKNGLWVYNDEDISKIILSELLPLPKGSQLVCTNVLYPVNKQGREFIISYVLTNLQEEVQEEPNSAVEIRKPSLITGDLPPIADMTCKVCLEHKINVVLQQCGHLAVCSLCASSIGKCPICRADIEKYTQVFTT